MLPKVNPTGILYILLGWYIGHCYGFVLLSSATGNFENSSLFQSGQSWLYDLHSTILLNENLNDGTGEAKNVGFYIGGEVLVESVWGMDTLKLLRFSLRSPKLHIRSRKAPSPDGFIIHNSKLDQFENSEFYVVWLNGKIKQLYLSKNESPSLANLKKGIASLFQLNPTITTEVNEVSAAGLCLTKYEIVSSDKFRKTKLSCESSDFPLLEKHNDFLGTVLKSFRETNYEVDPQHEYLDVIQSKETHSIYLKVSETVGNFIEVDQVLKYKQSDKTDVLKGSLNVVLKKLTESGEFVKTDILTVKELNEEDSKTFFASVNDVWDNLKPESLGGANSAKAFIKLVTVARSSTKEDIAKTLESKKNKQILPQLYDILGCVQTDESHEAVMKKLHFDKQETSDLSERYLWALAIHDYPNPDIILDLLKRYRKGMNIPEKVKQTLILTVASMAHKLDKSVKNKLQSKALYEVEEAILNGFDFAKDEEKLVFLRALRNLKSPKTIPFILKVIKTGSLKEGALAWRAIGSFEPEKITKDIIIAARRSFFQIDRKYDSSSRTIAVDIILDTKPSDYDLEEIVNYLKSNDTAFEVRQYVLQRLQMISEKDKEFGDRMLNFIKKDSFLNNYSTLNPGGFSVSLERQFLKNPSVNASLSTIQEVHNKIVKRGSINLILEKNGITDEFYSIGLFASGLSSFVSSSSEDDEEESVTAGMDLTIKGTQIRPFVFFSSQGELMGHVWSGTASERTTAYQGLIMLQDSLQYIRLESGFIAEFDIKGAVSMDLSGKVEMSLWNRNAQGIVGKSAGAAVIGLTRVDNSFVKSKVEFSSSLETDFYFEIDSDFSSNMKFCIRLTQTDILFRHNVFKVERIPGSKHKLRIAKYKKYKVPGMTYSLNRKNNDMCNAIFS